MVQIYQNENKKQDGTLWPPSITLEERDTMEAEFVGCKDVPTNRGVFPVASFVAVEITGEKEGSLKFEEVSMWCSRKALRPFSGPFIEKHTRWVIECLGQVPAKGKKVDEFTPYKYDIKRA